MVYKDHTDSFKKRIVKLHFEKGLSPMELANRFKVSYSNVTRWCRIYKDNYMGLPTENELEHSQSPASPAKTSAAHHGFIFSKPIFEIDGIKYTAEDINKKVVDYLDNHPYIRANDIETFVNIKERKVYFKINGYANSDFVVSL